MLRFGADRRAGSRALPDRAHAQDVSNRRCCIGRNRLKNVAGPFRQRAWFDGDRGAFLIVGPVTLVTLLIGVLNIHRHGIWLDEGYTLSFVTADRFEFARALHQLDGPLALYYLIVRWWISIFGHPFESGRLLSVIFGALTIPAIYVLGARLSSRTVGVISAILLAANTSFWLRVDDLRMYTLASFLSVFSYLLFVELAFHPRTTTRRWLVVGAALTSALLFSVQVVFGGLQLVAQVASIWTTPRERRRAPIAATVFGALLIAIVAASMLPLGRTETGWIGLTNPLYLGDVAALFGTHLTFGLLALAVVVAFVRRSSSGSVSLLLTWVLVPLLVAAAVSIVRPILIDRYLLGVLPPFIILAAIGINSTEKRFAYAFATAVFVAELAGTWHVDSVPHEDWNVAAGDLLRSVKPGDVVDVYPRDGVVGLVADLKEHGERLPASVDIIPDFSTREWMRNDTIDFIRAKQRGYRGTFPSKALTSHNTVWIVLRNELYWPPPIGYESLLRTFRRCSIENDGIEILQYRKRCVLNQTASHLLGSGSARSNSQPSPS